MSNDYGGVSELCPAYGEADIVQATPLESRDGFWADAKIGEIVHLRLFATNTGSGPGAAVFDVKHNKPFSSREWANDIEDAKQRAERIARDHCKHIGLQVPFPVLVWKRTGEHS